jgi:2-keto-4-pentenoate hydratase
MEYSDGATIPAASVLQPRIEGEVAMVLRRDLDAGFHSLGELIRAVDFALPAIEVVDSRIRDWDITLVDTVADNASSGCYVLGTRPVRLDQLDLCSLPMQLTLNDRVESTGNGAMCLGNPLNALRWLADMACALGSPLLTGQVVLTGALGPMVAATPGSRVSVDFGPLGQVRCTVGADG